MTDTAAEREMEERACQHLMNWGAGRSGEEGAAYIRMLVAFAKAEAALSASPARSEEDPFEPTPEQLQQFDTGMAALLPPLAAFRLGLQTAKGNMARRPTSYTDGAEAMREEAVKQAIAMRRQAPGHDTRTAIGWEDACLAVAAALRALPVPASADRKIYRVEHDSFEGTIQGSYVTREGREGVVLQQVGTKIVHVYRRDRIVPVE